MLKIYGSMLCKDCVECVEELRKADVDFEFCDFGEQLIFLKEFLNIREGNPVFDKVREIGSIGIPCIIQPDGAVTLEWDEFLK